MLLASTELRYALPPYFFTSTHVLSCKIERELLSPPVERRAPLDVVPTPPPRRSTCLFSFFVRLSPPILQSSSTSVIPLVLTLQVSSGYSPSHSGAMFNHRSRRGAIVPGSMEAKWAADAAREYALQEQADREAGVCLVPLMNVSTKNSIQ